MRIILLTNSLCLGGTERVVAGLCNDWAARGDSVTVIATYSGASEPFYPIAASAELIHLADIVGVHKMQPASYVRRLLALRRLIRARDPDVIVSFLPNVNVAAILSSLLLPAPLIICERSDPAGHRGFHVLKFLCWLTYRYANVLMVQTQGAADQAWRLYPGLKAVAVVPNALPAALSAVARQPSHGRKVLLSLGRLAPEKQLPILITAFAALAPHYPDWDLHIYGDGPERAALAAQIDKAGLQERVFLSGPTTRPWEIMAAADAFAMVSRNEGFPNALLEAMGIGLPCVVFDCPSGPRDITRDGKDALLIPLDDVRALGAALQRLMGDDKLRSTLGARARESVHVRYGHDRIMKLWDNMFCQVGAMRTAGMRPVTNQG